jgi:hypothetical protein
LQQRQVFKPDSDSQDKGGLIELVTPEQAEPRFSQSLSHEGGNVEPCEGGGVIVKHVIPPCVTDGEISGASFANEGKE